MLISKFQHIIKAESLNHVVIFMYLQHIVFDSGLLCILYEDTKMALLRTVFLQLVSDSTVFVMTFYYTPKNCIIAISRTVWYHYQVTILLVYEIDSKFN